jgi:hypothetical protein
LHQLYPFIVHADLTGFFPAASLQEFLDALELILILFNSCLLTLEAGIELFWIGAKRW